MNMDAAAAETPSRNSPSRPNFSPQLHFYIAVDRLQFKMKILLAGDIGGSIGHGVPPYLPLVVCCSTRNELDAVCSAVSNLSYISISPLYSDLTDAERCLVLNKFRQATNRLRGNAISLGPLPRR